MSNALEDSGLPSWCFAVSDASQPGHNVRLCERGRNYPIPMYVEWGDTVEAWLCADEMNALHGVTRAQARAMLAGCTLGWDRPEARPEFYTERKAA